MDFVKISFEELQPEQKEILIAQLADAGFEGFEETEQGLDAFIAKKDFDKALVNEITSKYNLQYSSSVIAATNWNAIWESNFEPVVVDDYVTVRAGFHPQANDTKFEIIITPKMSFGTGHHATTFMMMQMMREIDFTGKSVVDFGTGTGVLAILAEKEGAESITAIDNDDWSIENAAENFTMNHCRKIKLEKASEVAAHNKFDIILANINKNVILDNFSALCRQLKNKGLILFSGLLESDRDDIISTANEHKLILFKELTKNNWICLKLSN
jgi:ribosomal protein L11 methyltransferase